MRKLVFMFLFICSVFTFGQTEKFNEIEIASHNITLVEPANKPVEQSLKNDNVSYLTFQKKDGEHKNLMLNFNYCGYDWCFFNKIDYIIDGETYPIKFSYVSRWNEDRFCKEHASKIINDDNLISALLNAKTIVLIIYGEREKIERKLSKFEISLLRNTAKFYKEQKS